MYDNKTIGEVIATKFLGPSNNGNTLGEKTDSIITELSSARFAMDCSQIAHYKTISGSGYFAFFHPTVSYRVTFWRNSTDCKKVSTIQKEMTELLDWWQV